VQSSVGWTLGNFLENLTLTGNSNLNGTGNSLNNQITGNNAKNTLDGGSGNDTLKGEGGQDALYGGDGWDKLYGGSGNDFLNGSDGSDYLNGGSGIDTMYGGRGNDSYRVDSTGDTVVEYADQDYVNGGSGLDVVTSSLSYTLSDNVEWLVLEGSSAINGTGNSLNNIISSVDSNYTSVNNILNGQGGHDQLYGNVGNDTLIGGSGNDTLYGAGYPNWGKGEIDTLTGGSGADKFVLGDVDYGSSNKHYFYNDGKFSNTGVGDYALITDFNTSVDTIQLAGSAASYELKAAPISFGSAADTAIYINGSNSPFYIADELIAIVQDVSVANLSLNGSYFSFVA
jgi:Ca2+-binding RTX toxin-like protein